MSRHPLAKTGARGYGNTHQKLRARWAPKVATGRVVCWRCGKRIPAGVAWDLGHDDTDRTKYRGPEHVACNRGAAGRAVMASTVDTSRRW